jgi:NADH-quinone oxidoreductase subunit E
MSVETSIESKPTLLSESLRERILAYVPRYPSKRAVVLPALHLVQELFRCVPYKAMEEIAQLLDVAPAEVHDTMSFYGFFTQAPTGEKRVWMCRSISCMLRGGDELIDRACSKLGIEPGGASADGSISIVPAECLGICDYAPAALCDDGRIFGPLDDASTDAMLAEIRGGKST